MAPTNFSDNVKNVDLSVDDENKLSAFVSRFNPVDSNGNRLLTLQSLCFIITENSVSPIAKKKQFRRHEVDALLGTKTTALFDLGITLTPGTYQVVLVTSDQVEGSDILKETQHGNAVNISIVSKPSAGLLSLVNADLDPSLNGTVDLSNVQLKLMYPANNGGGELTDVLFYFNFGKNGRSYYKTITTQNNTDGFVLFSQNDLSDNEETAPFKGILADQTVTATALFGNNGAALGELSNTVVIRKSLRPQTPILTSAVSGLDNKIRITGRVSQLDGSWARASILVKTVGVQENFKRTDFFNKTVNDLSLNYDFVNEDYVFSQDVANILDTNSSNLTPFTTQQQREFVFVLHSLTNDIPFVDANASGSDSGFVELDNKTIIRADQSLASNKVTAIMNKSIVLDADKPVSKRLLQGDLAGLGGGFGSTAAVVGDLKLSVDIALTPPTDSANRVGTNLQYRVLRDGQPVEVFAAIREFDGDVANNLSMLVANKEILEAVPATAINTYGQRDFYIRSNNWEQTDVFTVEVTALQTLTNAQSATATTRAAGAFISKGSSTLMVRSFTESVPSSLSVQVRPEHEVSVVPVPTVTSVSDISVLAKKGHSTSNVSGISSEIFGIVVLSNTPNIAPGLKLHSAQYQLSFDSLFASTITLQTGGGGVADNTKQTLEQAADVSNNDIKEYQAIIPAVTLPANTNVYVRLRILLKSANGETGAANITGVYSPIYEHKTQPEADRLASKQITTARSVTLTNYTPKKLKLEIDISGVKEGNADFGPVPAEYEFVGFKVKLLNERGIIIRDTTGKNTEIILDDLDLYVDQRITAVVKAVYTDRLKGTTVEATSISSPPVRLLKPVTIKRVDLTFDNSLPHYKTLQVEAEVDFGSLLDSLEISGDTVTGEANLAVVKMIVPHKGTTNNGDEIILELTYNSSTKLFTSLTVKQQLDVDYLSSKAYLLAYNTNSFAIKTWPDELE